MLVKRFNSWIGYYFGFLRVLNSPLRPFRLKWYLGKIAIGHPYFLPRKRTKNGFKPIRWFGFDNNTFGYKVKWDDLVFEWAPSWSFIFLGIQLNVSVVPPKTKNDFLLADYSYWEAWLYYSQRTDKKLATVDRLWELFNIYSCEYICYPGEKKEDHMPHILREKYIKLYETYKKYYI